jgi:hypothetical protein
MRAFNFVLLILTTSWAFAQSKVAVVKMLRGDATLTAEGKSGKLALEQWVPAGSVVKTADKSFVRLVFIDKSQMNIGPNSEMKIEQFGGGDSGVIDLVKGQIRSQVSKDYLQQKDKDKSKLFIKTPNAVMGVRGTDFLIATNGINSSTVLFEGEIVFNKIDPASFNRERPSTDILEGMVERGVRVMPGEFSVVEANRPNPTVPSLMSVQQVEVLEKNQDFAEASQSAGDDAKTSKSVVPAGLSGQTVANAPAVLNKELAQSGVDSTAAAPTKTDAESAKGFVTDTSVKPTNGSILHVATGVIIAPPKDAAFDANSGTFVATGTTGKVDSSGGYVPPAGLAITDKGEVFAKVGNEIVKLDKLSAVSGEGATMGDVAKAIVQTAPAPAAGSAPAAVGGGAAPSSSKTPVSGALAAVVGQASTQLNLPNTGLPQGTQPIIDASYVPKTSLNTDTTLPFNPTGADQQDANKTKVDVTVGSGD